MIEDDEPLRAVTKLETLPRPRGGFVEVITLECGHTQWRRRRKERTSSAPPRPILCTSCWLDRISGR